MLLTSPVSSGSVIYDHWNLNSKNSKFKASIYIYKDSSLISGKYYFGFQILLHTDAVCYFDWVEKLVITLDFGTFDDWQPKTGTGTGGTISITPTSPAISISLPTSDIRVSGGFSKQISWYINPLGSNPQDISAAARLWTTDKTLVYAINVTAWSGYGILTGYSIYWKDTLYFTNIDLDRDGDVDLCDLTMVARAFGTSNPVCDFNHDGIVNILELTVIARHVTSGGGGSVG